MALSFGIIGITGKMGKIIASMILEDKALILSGGTTHKKNKFYDHPLSSILNVNNDTYITDDMEKLFLGSDVVIDFSHPSVVENTVTFACQTKTPLVIGTTGLTKNNFNTLSLASKTIPLLYSSNFSIGIAIINNFIKSLPPSIFSNFDASITEIHHEEKKDSPSGTAIKLSQNLKSISKTPSSLPIHSIRKGKEVGTHNLLFENNSETLLLSHKAKTRKTFAKGVLLSGKFVYDKPPHLYTIEDVLL
jgi:4-hydroxy-tetrahydrodipicolinate reductase